MYLENTHLPYTYSESLVLVLWFIYVYKLATGGHAQNTLPVGGASVKNSKLNILQDEYLEGLKKEANVDLESGQASHLEQLGEANRVYQ